MKNFHKPLFYIGISLTSVGSIVWLILTIINSGSARNYNHLNTLYPTGMGLLGITAVIISFLLVEIHSILAKKNKEEND